MLLFKKFKEILIMKKIIALALVAAMAAMAMVACGEEAETTAEETTVEETAEETTEAAEETAEETRKINVVKSAINTLSYTEMHAIVHIFEELSGIEGILVASKIADKAGITRSVVVNALRKFESAGVIESRSSGMKGTYIKVLNDAIYGELKELKKQVDPEGQGH